MFSTCLVLLFGNLLFSGNIACVSGNVPPEFDQNEYIVSSLAERSPIGTWVINVTAIDPDGDNITYILEEGEVKSKFSIDTKTGAVSVNGLLTKTEYPSRINLVVSAYDNVNGPDFKVSSALYVFLLDINDHSPQFINAPYHTELSENANIGDIVIQVKAVDEDTSPQYGLVWYDVQSGNEEGKFAVATFTGHITVVDTINFDKTNNYLLNISAMDGGRNIDYTTVTIKILDFDNLPAVFDDRTYLGSVPEDAPKGFFVIQVSAHDGDTLNAPVSYILDPASDKNKKFAIDNATGIITIANSLDRETASSYLLRIGAISTYHSPVYTTASIQVLDVNDNGPVFEQSVYKAFVPENSPVDLTVLQVIAHDADVGENSTLQYTLSGAEGKLDIRSSGHIVVKANIDRETQSQFLLLVTAQETLTTQRYESNATIIIDITDVNDHNPTCSQEVYKATVDENKPNGTFVAQIVGLDADSGKNAEIHYSLESDLDNHINLFTIDRYSGNITTLKPLDREQHNIFTLTITLRDQAQVEQKRTGSCFIQINIGDQNDNVPRFISLLNVTTVPEDAQPGTTVVIIKAEDDDVSSNGIVQYLIVSGNINDTFHLNASSGVLTTKRLLDRENIDQYNLIVNATDSGGMSQTEILIVTVTDQNDNVPQFHQNAYYFTVNENSAALLVGIVQASDEDIEENAEILYSLDPSMNSEKFTIEATTGTIKTAVALDRETKDSYIVIVVAKDKGVPSLSSNVTVYINISDVNDNIPYFTHKHYTISLNENEPSHGFLNLSAIDKDIGINSKLRYSILSGNTDGYFSVDGHTGSLYTTKQLDYESNQIFTLLVQVHDLDGNTTFGEPFQDNAVVYVTVKDLNDHSPEFTASSYMVDLIENITVGSEVILVRATDADSNENKDIEYSFLRGNELQTFYIDKNSGRITVKNIINRDPPENQTLFNITIMAKDNGIPSLHSTVQLIIVVEDANDNPPVFEQETYEVYLPENSPVGRKLIQLHCEDLDENQNGRFLFNIKSGVDKINPEFHIDNITGWLTTFVIIDYDLGKHDYRLIIEAIDQGRPQLAGTTTVTVVVNNTNDNSPQFLKPYYWFTLNEGSYVGENRVVGKISATDLDSDGLSSYGQLTYSLQNESSVFVIDGITGVITTNVMVDREQQSQYILVAMVQDNDIVAPRYNTTIINITIIDKNDNAPKFTKQSQTIHVSEGLPKGHHISMITAVDPDEGSKVTYSILNGDIDSRFSLNTKTGDLTTNHVLDRENQARYDLVIQAEDGDTPPLMSLAFITIIIDDVNDNSPVITTTRYASKIKENLPAGQMICQVSATDVDVDNQITYSVNYQEFSVNSSGFVFTNRMLDREEIPEYEIKVVATDNGLPPKSSFVMIKVVVEDANDNYPVFDQDLYDILISENTTAGSVVIQVTASDQDEGVNAEMTYTLYGGLGHFVINKTSGVITMLHSVDHERNPGGFIVFVEASDRGIPTRKSSTVHVNIGISDVNDNAPIFEQYGYKSSIKEDSDIGTIVVQVKAHDRDQGLLGEVTYTITDGNDHGLFSANNSGFIFVSGKLDREKQEFYELEITAKDRAGVPKAIMTQVNIHVLDTNDNNPMIVNAPMILHVNESTAINTQLYTVLAHDLDTSNDKLSYHTVNGDGVLDILTTTGVVILTNSLNYAVKQRHVLEFFVSDNGSPSLKSETSTVTIVVIKEDSTTSMFDHPSYIFTIPEDTGIDNVVGRVNVISLSSNTVYNIISGNTQDIFDINQQGMITLMKVVDYEIQTSHTIIVTATSGGQVGQAAVTFMITDINDTPPIFQFTNYYSEVKENVKLDTLITQVEAFDPDYGVTTNLKYTINGGNEEGKFKITTTNDGIGLVSVAGSLDRETTEYYTLLLSVSDGSMIGNGTLHIKVNDINDNKPVFQKANYQGSVVENTGAGFAVLRVAAFDADLDENAEVFYSISGGTGVFTIDEISGEIQTTEHKLDREFLSSYDFQVVATDIGGLKGTADVVILVNDMNDNAPIFAQSSYTTQVIEGEKSMNLQIFKAQATDKDLGENSEILYSITNGNLGNTFMIDNQTGAIFVANEVDREMDGLKSNEHGIKMFRLGISAADNGKPSLTTTTMVIIQVADINDNAPMFPRDGYIFMISKDAQQGMVVTTVEALDKDDKENGRVVYEISHGNNEGDFVMDAESGVLKMAKDLQRNIGYQYNLSVKATDNGTPPLSSTTTVLMTVGENNLHPPILTPKNYSIAIYENNLHDTVIVNVTALDLDDGQNGEILYTIISGNGQSLFTITNEANNGQLIGVGQLDREKQDHHILEIMAKDGGIPIAFQDTGYVTITLLDLNDNAPVFSHHNFTGNVHENCAAGVTVMMDHAISARDIDQGINAEITFTIEGEGSQFFSIDRTTAVLKTNTSTTLTLDYEASPEYTFMVVATDQNGNGRRTSVPVTIHLIDENDNIPSFQPPLLHIQLQESTPIGTLVVNFTAMDPDSGANGLLRYAIISGSAGHFTIGQDDGQLRVSHGLDREVIDKYIINVSAIDGDLYPKQGFGVVRITLLDVNDHPPVFDQLEYRTVIPEDVPIGHRVLTVHASDVDVGSSINYYLDHASFTINQHTGEITTTTTLDRETLRSYSLPIQAKDGSFETSVALHLTISDVNDNVAYFPGDNQYYTDLSETTSIGAIVTMVAASDDDEERNAEISYSITHNVDNLFEIASKTGIMTLKKSLSKDDLINQGLTDNSGEIQVTIEARDHGDPRLSSNQIVKFRIVPPSDAIPSFDKHFYQFTISEDIIIGSSVGSVKAVVKTTPGKVTYFLDAVNQYFEINQSNGTITTKYHFNQEKQAYFVFTIQARDEQSNIAYTSVGVTVLDVNEDAPVFQFKPPYKMSVVENIQPGATIGSLKAFDVDESSQITYSFVQANVGTNGMMVAIDSLCYQPLGMESGNIPASHVVASTTFVDSNKDFSATQARLNNKPTAASGVQYQGAWCAAVNNAEQFLQVDMVEVHKITKIATQGRPSGSSYVTKYTLRHSDDGTTWLSHEQEFNGNGDSETMVSHRIFPAFRSRYVRLIPMEWSEQICLRMELYGCVYDRDEVIIPFIIDEHSGEVNVSEYLDRETQDQYTIIAQASDNGEPTLKSNTTLEINILDYNDHIPSFQHNSYYVTISEHSFPGDQVVQLTASDPDTGINGDVTYTIISGGRDMFFIDETTGVIQPKNSLDFEKYNDRYFVLNISASDHGITQLTSYTIVYVNITDYNDNYPVFDEASLVAHVAENLEAGSIVTTLLASDLDYGENSLIQYSLLGDTDAFLVDTTSGVVQTTRSLDRETISDYFIKITATDSGKSPLSTESKLHVKVMDVNDNPPVFTEAVYTRKILENSAQDTIVVKIEARDLDSGPNGRVNYSISQGNEKGLFMLDSSTGFITVVKPLDHEVNSTIRFSVTAQDQTPPYHVDQADVVVIVTDVNDNAPVIYPKHMVVVLNEDVDIGTFVVDVNATDKDSSSNAQLQYSIVLGSSGHFHIDPDNGIITTAVKLDFETTKHYTVLVMVRDKTATDYMDFGSVEVSLNDVNDNAPQFIIPPGPHQVKENQPSGTQVTVIRAKDIDTDPNVKISFKITGGDTENCFTIGLFSGVITTTKPLDREREAQYLLTITASNSGDNPTLSTSTSITIDVTDTNDNAPQFNSTISHGVISEDSSIGSFVSQVFATDSDENEAAQISYALVNGSHLFNLDNNTGIITLQRSIIDHEYRILTFMVEARDHGSPWLSNITSVLVNVMDVNDNAPVFDKRVYSASVSESALVGDSVVQMIASDADSNGGIYYEMVEGNGLGHFRISEETGWIYVNQTLDRETTNAYVLGVRALNKAENMRRRKRNVDLSDTVRIEISIGDVNDNLPIFNPLVYVGGVMPDADVGTLIVQVMATDADSGVNSELAYHISSGNIPVHFHMSSNTGKITATSLSVGPSGTLYQLQVFVQDRMGAGSISLLPATVKIYSLYPNEQVIVLARVSPLFIRNNTDEFIKMLSNITDSQVYIDKIFTIYERDENGKLRPNSEVLFHAVRNLTILSDEHLLSVVKGNRYLLDTLYAKWKIKEFRKVIVISNTNEDDNDDDLLAWEIALIVIGLIIPLFLLLLCCLCCCCKGWRENIDEERTAGTRQTIFTNSPVYVTKMTRQNDGLVDSFNSSHDFYSSSHSGPFSLSQNIANPVYSRDVDSDGYEEKEMELSLSDEDSDENPDNTVSKNKKKSFKKSFRK